MSLPFPDFGPTIEDHALSETPICDRTDKAGVLAFRDFIIGALGGGDLGIDRPCERGKPSDHHERAAWDWALDAANPEDAARAAEFLDWLLATDQYGNAHAMLRRLGITFVIWNRDVWSTRFKEWHAYTGQSPHTDHVHISFGRPGARGETSFFRWLRGEEPEHVGPPAVPAPVARVAPDLRFPALLGGLALGWIGLMPRK